MARWLRGLGEIAEHGESESARVSAYALIGRYLGISEKWDVHHHGGGLPEGLTAEEIRAIAAPLLPDWPEPDVPSAHVVDAESRPAG